MSDRRSREAVRAWRARDRHGRLKVIEAATGYPRELVAEVESVAPVVGGRSPVASVRSLKDQVRCGLRAAPDHCPLKATGGSPPPTDHWPLPTESHRRSPTGHWRLAATSHVERRARAFAAELLLPRHIAGQAFLDHEGEEARTARSLCSRFGVSTELLAWQVRTPDTRSRPPRGSSWLAM